MIDLDKAEALLRAEGLAPYRAKERAECGGNTYLRSISDSWAVGVQSWQAFVEPPRNIDPWFHPFEIDALVSTLTRLAALCRRIEAECQVTP